MRDLILIEVRDRNLTRVGAIETEVLDARLVIGWNTVGAWTIKLPVEHHLTDWLRAPGAGIIATWKPTGQVLLSGPTATPMIERGPEDPSGLVTISGHSDDVILADAVAWGQPTNPDVEHQTVGWDTRTGAAETVLRGYVDANIGPSAPAIRRPAWSLASRLQLQPDLGRGAMIKGYQARFKNLLEVCQSVSTIGGIGFRIAQHDQHLELQISQPTDQSATIRLDIRNGTVAREELAITPPTMTRAYIMGQGEGAERQIVARQTTESAAAEQTWARLIERAIDQRNTDDPEELAQAGNEKLITEGHTGVTANIIPADDLPSMRLWEDFAPGDSVAVNLAGQELVAQIASVSVLITKDGAAQAVSIGDPAAFSPASATASRTADASRRVANLETNAEQGGSGGPVDASRIVGTLDPARLPSWLRTMPPRPRHLTITADPDLIVTGDNVGKVCVWTPGRNDGGQPATQADGIFYTAANQLRVPIAGTYLVTAGLCWKTGSATGYLYLDLNVGSNTVTNALSQAIASVHQQNATMAVRLNAGDLLTVVARQTSTNARSLYGSWCHWSVAFLNP